jgi:homoserine dehydrogenase
MGSDLPEVAVAVIGCGTVGGSTAEILLRDRELLRRKCGVSLKLKYIVDRNFTYAKQLKLDNELYEQEFNTVLEDPEVQVVLELIGGQSKAKDITEQALRAGKHVVTANKALLAHHGRDLMKLARENGVVLAFEASCGGGIPILRAIYDGLIANEIEAIYGIVNGTCNFILTQMIQHGETYEEALWAAQSKGLAEADPTLDVTGLDSAHKIAIMASMAFGVGVDYDEIEVQGINELDRDDVLYGAKLGYVVKLLAIATRESDGVAIRVRPAFISKDHPLAWVSGPFNAVSLYGHTTGHTMYYGRGAGGSPTGSAVVADVASIARGSLTEAFDKFAYWPDRNPQEKLLPTADTSNRYYVRILADDRPGTLSRIAEIFGKHEISIASVLQDELPEHLTDASSPVRASIVITLHRSVERNVLAAIEEVNALSFTGEQCSLITIVEEHSERLS